MATFPSYLQVGEECWLASEGWLSLASRADDLSTCLLAHP